MLNVSLFLAIISISINSCATIFLGEDAHIAKFSYQVSLRYSGTAELFCGGAILNESFIITAAHCMYDGGNKELKTSQFYIIAGQSELKLSSNSKGMVYASSIIKHPWYQPWVPYMHDIALIELVKKLPVTNSINSIQLNDKEIVDGLVCTVSGWSTSIQPLIRLTKTRKTSETLKSDTSLMAMSRKTCRSSKFPPTFQKLVPAGTFCTENTRSNTKSDTKDNLCRVPDDSGGPLVCNNRLAGIVSLGMDCATKGIPAIYTDVKQHLLWIRGVHKIGGPPKRRSGGKRRRGGGSSPKCFCNSYIYALTIIVIIKFWLCYYTVDEVIDCC